MGLDVLLGGGRLVKKDLCFHSLVEIVRIAPICLLPAPWLPTLHALADFYADAPELTKRLPPALPANISIENASRGKDGSSMQKVPAAGLVFGSPVSEYMPQAWQPSRKFHAL